MRKNIIDPIQLFDSETFEYHVETSKLGRVSYVNLDNAATTPPLKSVNDEVRKYLHSYGSVHRGAGAKSKKSTDLYEESRDTIREFVNAPMDSYVLFTQNSTGAMNTIAHFFSFLKGKIAVSSIEHSSSWLPWIKAEGIRSIGAHSYELNELENINNQIQEHGRSQVLQYEADDQFEFQLPNIEKLLMANKIKALVLTASSNLNGYCPDIRGIGKLTHKYGALFVVDACQFIQHHKIDMQEMGIDFLVASGHKFYAPYGSGFLIGPKIFFDKFLPYQIGGGNIPYITESGEFLRYQNQLAHDPGTPNAIGAVAMSAALKKLKEIGIENVESYEKDLTEKLYSALAANPKVEMYVNKKQLNTVIPFNLNGIRPSNVAEQLNQDFGIGVRAGSFCVYHVLRKLLKIKDESEIINEVRQKITQNIPALVRASVGLCNTEDDIDRFIQAINCITDK